MQNPNLLSSQQAANMLGISVDQVRKMISRKEMNTMQVSDRSPHVIPIGEVIRHKPFVKKKSSMSFDDYQKIDALNATSLKRFDKSLNHYLFQEFEQTPSMVKGIALHDYVEHKMAGRDFYNYYAVTPNLDKRTKTGKEELGQFLRENENKKILSEADNKDIVAMGNAILSNQDFWQLVEGKNKKVEEVLLWTHEGIRAKARLDYSRQDRDDCNVVDIKTCQDATFKGFRGAVFRYLYHIQAQWYRIGYKAVYGVWPWFVFCAVENHPPYNVALYELHSDILAEAQERIDISVDLYKRFCNGELVSKGYHEGVECIWA